MRLPAPSGVGTTAARRPVGGTRLRTGPRTKGNADQFDSAHTEHISPMRTTRASRRHVHVLALVIHAVTVVIVGILVLHILLVLLDANPANDLVRTLSDWADGVAGWAKDLFTPDNAKARVFVNEGLAAVVYALIGGALGRAVARV
jgi:hypothetical protein